MSESESSFVQYRKKNTIFDSDSDESTDDNLSDDVIDASLESAGDVVEDSILENKIEEPSEQIVISSDEEGLISNSTESSSSPNSSSGPSNSPENITTPSTHIITTKPNVGPNEQVKNEVNAEQYQIQLAKVASLQSELSRARNALQMVRPENLPDKGKSLMERAKSVEEALRTQRNALERMSKPQSTFVAQNKILVEWDQIESGVGAVGPRTFGKKGIERFRVEQQLAVDALQDFHKSLETRPAETDTVDDPKGLKVPLMAHQKRALKWLLWRETQSCSGGLLADDMGLGKTLTMISLVLKSNEGDADEENENENVRNGKVYPGGTLVVCPASLLEQWSGEIKNKTKRGLISFEIYHGGNRESKAKRLARNDVVITTYAIVRNERKNKDTLFQVRWQRIILDEAHQIRNHKSQVSEAACDLDGKSRWALTGTPVHNKEQDMYALIKFLRCAPYDDLRVWKMWLADKSTGGEQRLHAIISSLMLRRTKQELMNAGTLQSLPQRSMEIMKLKLDTDEMGVYQKVLIFSRTLFAQFLHQRAEKSQDLQNLRFGQTPHDPNGEYFKMRNRLLKLNRVQNVSQTEILVLLLRLRQICCHPSLIVQMLQGDEDLGNAEDEEEAQEINLLDQLNKLDLEDHDDDLYSEPSTSEETNSLKQTSKRYMNPSHPIFAKDRQSTKIKAVVQILKERVPKEDKAIIVSQWTGFLNLIAPHLKAAGLRYSSLDGTIPVPKRMPLIDDFNNPHSSTRILLLSLTAGGVGLNLVGANHLLLVDLHWNPQLENQAQDRIYRMGQAKPIFVYKFVAEECIEEGIQKLQENKLAIADSLLTGSKKASTSKLSLQDLKMLFNFN